MPIIERSLAPSSDKFKVLGIGVAVSVSVSTLIFIERSFSFAVTPKRCSSSIINSPRSRNFISLDKILCVPITTSTCPVSRFLTISVCYFLV